MPKFKKRTTSRGSWKEDEMLMAIKLVLNEGQSERIAAKSTGVPRSTLKDRLNKIRKGEEVQMSAKLGRYECTFSESLEAKLVNYMRDLDNRLMPLTRKEFLKLIYDLAQIMNIPHAFSEQNETAGKNFYYGFIKRHPELALRKPESTSLSRAVGFNKPQVKRFYSKFEELKDKHNFSPSRIFNCDETGVTCVSGNSMVVSFKGKRQVGKLTSAERGRNITILFCMSPTGVFIPSLFIFPRKRMNQRLMMNAPAESLAEAQSNGWMNGQIFLVWMKKFVEITHPTKNSPVLLVLDGHASHKDLAVIEFARTNHVHMLSLPPHTSHKMQPLDRTFMKPFKLAYGEQCNLWLRQHPGLRISDYDIAGLVHEAYKKVCKLEIAQNGFSSTGIHPFNPIIFSDADFAPSLITDIVRMEPEDNIDPSRQEPNNTPQDIAEDNASQEEIFQSQLHKLVPLPDSTQRRKLNSRKRRSEHSEILTDDTAYETAKSKAQEKIQKIEIQKQKQITREEKRKANEIKKKK